MDRGSRAARKWPGALVSPSYRLPLLALCVLPWVVLGFAARARAEPPVTPDEGLVHWWPNPELDPDSAAAQRPPEFVSLVLPRVAAAGEDIDLGPQVGMLRWIVNLTADGALVFAGRSFPFDDTDEAKAKLMRRTAAKELAREWKKAHAGHEHLGLLVRADCRNPWGRVHLLLAWVLGVVDSVDAIHFAVDTGAVRDGAPLDGRIEVLSREPGAASNPTITADLIDVGGAKQPRIVWGERAWTFPGGEPYAAGPGLDEANATWDSILAALRAVPGTPRPILRLAFDPRVPWSHVAQFLGLVRLAGIPNVDLVRERLALTLSTPPPDLALRIGGRTRVKAVPADSGSSLPLVGSLLGALLVGVGLVAGQRVRRRRAAAFPEVLVGRRGPKPVPVFDREPGGVEDFAGAPPDADSEAPSADAEASATGQPDEFERFTDRVDGDETLDETGPPSAPEGEGRDTYPSDG